MQSRDSWVDSLQEEAVRRLDGIIAAQEELIRAQGKARSPRGEVVATATANGVPSGLELSEAALEMRPEALAGLILTTQQRAAADGSRRAVEVLAPVVGREQAQAMLSARLSPEKVREMQQQRDMLRDGGR